MFINVLHQILNRFVLYFLLNIVLNVVWSFGNFRNPKMSQETTDFGAAD